MKNSTVFAVLLIAIGVGSLLVGLTFVTSNPATYPTSNSGQQQPYLQSQGSFQGMMSGYSYGMMSQGVQQWSATAGQSVSIQQAIQMMRSIPTDVTVESSKNTVTIHSKSASVLVIAIMPDKAANLTGIQPPSYSTGDVFVIDGLINPTLVTPPGASIQFTVVNLDNDMYHNFVISPYGPPYAYVPMQGMMSGYSMPMAMMFLPPADYSQGLARTYSYTLAFNQPGTMWYFCTYRGHAQSGMYGQITVTG